MLDPWEGSGSRNGFADDATHGWVDVVTTRYLVEHGGGVCRKAKLIAQRREGT